MVLDFPNYIYNLSKKAYYQKLSLRKGVLLMSLALNPQMKMVTEKKIKMHTYVKCPKEAIHGVIF